MRLQRTTFGGSQATLAFSAAIVLTVSLASPSFGASAVTPDEEVYSTIANVDESLLTAAVAVEPGQDADRSLTAKSSEVVMRLPFDPSENVSLAQNDGSAIEVRLPFADQASDAIAIADGAVAYDNNNNSTTAPIARTDGSIQINTIIDSDTAPTSYTYKFSFPKTTDIVSVDEALVFMEGETLLGGIAPAWAKDATGNPVPTRFEVNGDSVTQVIEHDATFEYPIVADPWLNINLFEVIMMDDERNQPRVNLTLSTWGWAVYTGVAQGGGLGAVAAGQAILDTAGWDEATSYAIIRDALWAKPTMRQQFSCHALGAIAAGEWNLESWRLNRINGDWGVGVYYHHCNWETADLY